MLITWGIENERFHTISRPSNNNIWIYISLFPSQEGLTLTENSFLVILLCLKMSSANVSHRLGHLGLHCSWRHWDQIWILVIAFLSSMSPASSNSHPTEMASSTALLPLLAWLRQHLPFGGVHLPRLPIQIYSLFCPSRQFPILHTQKDAFPSCSVSFYGPEGYSPFLFLVPFVQPIWGGSEILHNFCLPLLCISKLKNS